MDESGGDDSESGEKRRESRFDERVGDDDRVTLTRRPEVSDKLVREVYPHARTEQEAIRMAMNDAVRWNDEGIRPDQLVSALVRMLDGEPTAIEAQGVEFVVSIERA